MDPNERLYEKWRAKPSKFIADIIGVSPFPYQAEFLDAVDRTRRVFVSGRQVGKSRTCSWAALHHALCHKDHTILITSPTQRQSSELFNTLKKEMQISDLPKDAWGISRETRTLIEFENGSRIICLPTGRDGANIRSYTADFIIVDEAAFVPDDIFTQVLGPMLSVTSGTLILASTPFGASGYLYKKFALDDEWFKVRVPTSANPLVEESFLKEQERTMPSMQFRQEYLGEFVEQADLFFGPEVKNCMVQSGFVDQEDEVCYLGADIAQHGEDESVFISIDAEGNVFDIQHTKDTDLTDSIGRIQVLDQLHNYATIYIDATGLGTGVVDTCRERIGRKVEGFAFSSIDKKQDLYQNLRRQLQDEEIRYPDDEQGKVLIHQLQGMKQAFTSHGKIKIEEPESGHDDYADALALAAWARSRRKLGWRGAIDFGTFNE